jgi:hypothetical protein
VSNARRVNTLRAIAAGARGRIGSAAFVHVDHELQELGSVAHIAPEKRKHLLQLLHATRALDTALKEVIRSYHITPQHSLGPVLKQLSQLPLGAPGHITTADYVRFMSTVRVARNRFAHEANAFPRSARETESILSEIEVCFVKAVR